MRRLGQIPVGLALLTILAACSPKVPDHLRVDPPTREPGAAAAAVTDITSALSVMMGKDPLARSPRLLPPDTLAALEGGAPLAAYVRQIRSLETGEGQVERALQQIEDDWVGSAAVALARGYRLRVVENILATGSESLDEAAEQQILALISPLQGIQEDDTLPRRPLDWLVEDRRVPETVRAYGDRWVLTAWLQHPSIPLAPAAKALAAPMYDGLSQTALGALVRRRGAGAAHRDVTGPMADLARATALALAQAAADRDREQAAWSDLKRTAAAELGSDDPEGFLLQRAQAALTLAASQDAAVGGALLAYAANRWHGRCEQPPCVAIDRVETMRLARAWDPEVARLAAVWQVIALKEALDTMEVGHDTVLFPRATVDLVDALIGTGAGPLEIQLLRRRVPDPAVWLAIGRSVGTEAVTDWQGARAAVGEHLENITRNTDQMVEDPELSDLLSRIVRRAIP